MIVSSPGAVLYYAGIAKTIFSEIPNNMALPVKDAGKAIIIRRAKPGCQDRQPAPPSKGGLKTVGFSGIYVRIYGQMNWPA
jgi:hypothetical protein